jgi:kynurenine formamidase
VTSGSALVGLIEGLLQHDLDVVDLSAPLGPDTPILKLPPDFGADTPKIEIHTISAYDQQGPFWAWNWLKLGEHSGTHFDAPHHWITGKDFSDGYTDTIPTRSFVAPVIVIDCSAQSRENHDFLLSADGVRAWESKHGTIGKGSGS